MSFYSKLYNLVLLPTVVVASPVWLPVLLSKKKHRVNFWQRLGFLERAQKERLPKKPRIWFHAVSVGEFNLTLTLINVLRPMLQDKYSFVVSVTTATGYEVAMKKLPPEDGLIYFPAEFYFSMEHVIKVVDPVAAVIMETEIWPNFIWGLKKRGIPILLANGRLSDNSFHGYGRIKLFVKDVLRNIDRCMMQTPGDARRLLRLGARADTVSCDGNIKFDSVAASRPAEKDPDLIGELKMPGEGEIFLAAALEKSGREDEMIMDVFALVRRERPGCGLVMVPRHPERGPAMAELIKSRGFVPRMRSKKETFEDPKKEIYIVDTVGELKRFYTLCDIAYVGKSMFPPGGGQNMLEPVALGRPTLYGPHTKNFRGIADVLAQKRGAEIVQDAWQLKERVCELLKDKESAAGMVGRGQEYIRAQQGVTARIADEIVKML
ncbi:hypothetical protein IKZ40_09095 [bacterium]|nr:hypothetical protein [bacterium]